VTPALLHSGLQVAQAYSTLLGLDVEGQEEATEYAKRLGLFSQGQFGTIVGAKVEVMLRHARELVERMKIDKRGQPVTAAYKRDLADSMTTFARVWTGLRSTGHTGFRSWNGLVIPSFSFS